MGESLEASSAIEPQAEIQQVPTRGNKSLRNSLIFIGIGTLLLAQVACNSCKVYSTDGNGQKICVFP